MIVILLTVYREPNYLPECIRTIREDYKGIIHLMIGGSNYEYVKEYDKGFVKHYLDESGIKENYKKACKGYAECLALGEKEGVLIIEDDTTFNKGWYQQFQAFLATVQDARFVLSLGDPVKGSVQNPDIKTPSLQRFLYRVELVRNPGNIPNSRIICWHDSHAVYYPPGLPIKDMVGFLKHFGVEKSSMHDLIIGYYLFRRMYPIYITVPRLANNVGAYNTHVGLIENLNTDYTDWDYSNF